MYSWKHHFNSLLLIAGFIMLASGSAELAFSDSDPEESKNITTYQAIQDFNPQGAGLSSFFAPEDADDVAPEQPRDVAVAPEVSTAEAPEELNPNYDGELERYATGNMLRFIEGSFGALIMVSAGLGAIVAAAFGGYKVAISLLFVAVGAFILRALVSLFFGGGFDATDVDFVG